MSERKKISDIADFNGVERSVSVANLETFALQLVKELKRKAIIRGRRSQSGRAIGFRAAANIIAEAFELD